MACQPRNRTAGEQDTAGELLCHPNANFPSQGICMSQICCGIILASCQTHRPQEMNDVILLFKLVKETVKEHLMELSSA